MERAQARRTARPRRLRGLHGRRGERGDVRLGRGRAPLRGASGRRLPIRGPLVGRRRPRDARLRDGRRSRRVLRWTPGRARRARDRGPHGVEGPQGGREGGRPELPELRRLAPAQGPREHGAGRLRPLRLAPRVEGRGRARQVRGPQEARRGSVQARGPAGERGDAPRPHVRGPRRRPEGGDLGRNDLPVGRVPPEGREERGLPLARRVQRPLHAARARACGRRRGFGPVRDVQGRALPRLLAQPRAGGGRRRRVLLGRRARRADRRDRLRRASADALLRAGRQGIAWTEGSYVPQDEIAAAFRPKELPGTVGVGACQPWPHAGRATCGGRRRGSSASGRPPLRRREGHRAEPRRLRPDVRPRRTRAPALRRTRLPGGRVGLEPAVGARARGRRTRSRRARRRKPSRPPRA